MKLRGAGSGGNSSRERGLGGAMRELAGSSSRNSPCKAHWLPLFGDGGAGAAGLSLTIVLYRTPVYACSFRLCL
jgi:hypothetical protein